MIVWFWANVLLTVFALIFVRINSNAPHRLRFLVCFIAMCCWLVPWALLGRLAPTSAVSMEFLPGPQALGAAAQTVSPVVAGSGETALMRFTSMADTLLLVATMIGVMLFAASCYRYARFLKRLSSASTTGDYLWDEAWVDSKGARSKRRLDIRIQREVPGALTTGLLTPTLWVHEDLLTSPHLEAALLHEFTHARNHDNAYLWVITFIQKILWWNPLVHCLGYLARRLQELSCDEACDKRLSGYRDMLNRLILTLSTSQEQIDVCVQAPSVYGCKNFSVHRIHALDKRYVMRTRHYVSTALLLLGSLLALSWATAQVEGAADVTVTVNREDLSSVDELIQALAKDGIEIAELEPGLTMEEAYDAYKQLSVYATILDLQWDALERERAALQSELDALRDANAEETVAEDPPVTGPDGDLEPIVVVAPIYPPRALAREFEGYVIVEYTVTERGTTADVNVIDSNSSLFHRAAIQAVQNYEYRPRIEDGRAVAVSGVRSRIDFELED